MTEVSNAFAIDAAAPRLPRRPFPFVLHFLGFYRWPLLAMFLLETGQAFCQIMLPYAIKRLIDAGGALHGTFDEALVALRPSLTLFAGLSLGILFCSRASGSLLVILGPALRRRVRQNLFRYLQFHSHRYFIGNFAGSLANRISEVSVGVNHSVWTIMFDFWPVAVTFGTSLFLMHRAHAALALPLACWTALYVAVSFLLARRCQKYAKAFAATRSMVSGKIVDSVTNAMNTKIFAKLGFERTDLDGYLDVEVAAARKTFWFMEGMRWFQFVATMLLQIGMVLFAIRLWIAGEMSVGSFAMVASLALAIINEARGLSRRFLEFFEYIGNVSDGVGIIVRDHEVVDAADAAPIRVTRGEVRFEDVSFAYVPGKPIFERLNVAIAPGERVGLVGFSGSGKTTFLNLILRLYDVGAGKITIDGQDVARATQDSVRAQVGVIPQDPMLFHRSLLENIRYGRLDATDDEVFAAARVARAHEFITQLPEGYGALVGERGVKLSGGQRQRVAIARAVLKNAPILVLDEATSSLDSVTEKAIQDSFETVMRGRTVIVVAHRLSTIARLDRILVFHEGKVVEDGTHAALLAADGRYARLWQMQVGGFLPDREEAAVPLAG